MDLAVVSAKGNRWPAGPREGALLSELFKAIREQ